MNISKVSCITKVVALLICLSFYSIQSFASQEGRLTLRGLTGTTTYADIDALLPLYPNCNSLLYADVQARYNQRDVWFAGIGLGYRDILNNYILGSNVFIDRAESKHHRNYWIVSPGLETIMPCWDVRVNGYIPVSRRRKDESHFFPSGLNECGIHDDCSFVEFSGHQQFEHRFLEFEEVGVGGDLIAGFNLSSCNCVSLHAGVYYYHLEDTRDITGVGARLDVPFNTNWGIISEASYDNEEHTAVTIGLRFQLGHTPAWGSCPNLCDRLYDPILRHIGPLEQGAGVPIVHHQKDEGLFLRRDNIVFFSERGTAVLGDLNAGTFENPFADDQFTDATVLASGVNANFYFGTGDYVIDTGLPDNRVTLLAGQSIFGRTEDFKCTAVDLERPILEGGIDIVDSSHTLDSIVLNNTQTSGGTTVTALTLTNAQDVHLCNDVIHAEANVSGAGGGINAAIGIAITTNNVVTIEDSLIEAIALVSGDNAGDNVAIGIGNFNLDVTNNIFLISGSEVSANARVALGNTGNNLATSIGTITDTVATPASFTNNVFAIDNSILSSIARVTDNVLVNFASNIGNEVLTGSVGNFTDNAFSINCTSMITIAEVEGDNAITAFNFATNIGNNEFTAVGASTGTFDGNNFLITDSLLSAFSRVRGANNNNNFVTNIGNNLVISSGDFAENNFSIIGSDLSAIAQVEGDNAGINAATNIGTNSVGAVSGNFIANLFVITDSTLSAFAEVRGTNTGDGLNEVASIGNNAFVTLSNFADNIFVINDAILNAIAEVFGDNAGSNFATVIGNNGVIIVGPTIDFIGNNFTINNTTLSSAADVEGDNALTNAAKNIGNNPDVGTTFANNVFNITCTLMDTQAVIDGDNTGTNLTMGVDLSGPNNNMNISASVVDVLALVGGANTSNTAIGLSALGADSVLRIFDSLVNVAALADSELNTAISTQGNVIAINTIFNVIENP